MNLTEYRLTLDQAHAAMKRSRPTEIKIWMSDSMKPSHLPFPQTRNDAIAYLSFDYDLEVIKLTFFTEHRPLAEIDQMLRDAKRLTMAIELDSGRTLREDDRTTPYSGMNTEEE